MRDEFSTPQMKGQPSIDDLTGLMAINACETFK